MVKIGVVGCGGIGRTHINAYGKVDGASVVYCVDPVPELARQAADLCGAQALTHIGELPLDVDGISLTTPPATHFSICRDLLERGFNVFCEKPLGMNTDEAKALAETATRKDRILSVGYKMRFEPIFAKAKELLGEIGRLRTVAAVKLQPYKSRGPNDWVPRTGAMRELSVHDFDLIHWIAGIEPVAVKHAKLEHGPGWDKDTSFMLTVEYHGADGPVLGQLQGMYSPDASFCYRDLTLTFVGDQGYMRVERPDRIVLHLDSFSVHEVDPGNVNAFVAELNHFCRVLRGEEANTLGPKYGIMAAKLIDDAERANAAG